MAIPPLQWVHGPRTVVMVFLGKDLGSDQPSASMGPLREWVWVEKRKRRRNSLTRAGRMPIMFARLIRALHKDNSMITKEDIRLVLAYFNLKASQEYCPYEIAYRPTIRAKFLNTAKQVLGEVPAKEIIRQLLALKRTSRQRAGNRCAEQIEA